MQQQERQLTEAEQELRVLRGAAVADSDLRARVRELTQSWREAKCASLRRML